MKDEYIAILIAAGIIIGAGIILNIIISQAIKLYFAKKASKISETARKRNNTIMHIVVKLVRYLIIFQVIMLILDLIPGIDTKTILATLGVGGIAIGFGMQTLVKDVITGFFILWEDQFAIGDYVKTVGYEGLVEEFDLRITKLRAISGELCFIPNGKIETLANYSKGPIRFRVALPIAYEADVEKAIALIEELSEDIKKEFPHIQDGPTVIGISALAGSAVEITVIGTITYLDTFAVERAIRKLAKQRFSEANIEIPYNKVHIINDRT